MRPGLWPHEAGLARGSGWRGHFVGWWLGGVEEPLPSQAPGAVLCIVFSPQLGANALLFLGVNVYGIFVRILAERAQRKAFLQARNCIEDRLRLEDENEKQVSAQGLTQRGVGGLGSGDGASQPSTPRALGVGPVVCI